jgi:hypothetical protein
MNKETGACNGKYFALITPVLWISPPFDFGFNNGDELLNTWAIQQVSYKSKLRPRFFN